MALLEHRQEGSPLQLSRRIADKAVPLAEKDVADRLVYKLVRVEEDGTVVPATEDEVIQMESLLEGDASIKPSKAESGGTNLVNRNDQVVIVYKQEDSHGPKDKSSVGSQNIHGLEAERKNLLAQLEFLDVILQNLKDEEHQRAASEGLNSVAGYFCNATKLIQGEGSGEHASQRQSVYVDLDSKWECKSDANVLSPDTSDDPGRKFLNSVEQTCHSKMSAGELESPLSTNKHSWVSSASESSLRNKAKQRDSSDVIKGDTTGWACDLLKGIVCLDNLSIRELHEAFRTTFGRQTSVKDKQWLKRRISMGLRSFHEVANNNVVLEGKRTGVIAKEGDARVRPGSSSPAEQPLPTPGIIQVVGNMIPEAAVGYSEEPKFLDHKKRSRRGAHQPNLSAVDSVAGNLESSENKHQLQITGDREGKRQRKPTKRYIEELALSDPRPTTGKPSSIAKDSDHGNAGIKLHGRTDSGEWEGQSGRVHSLVSGLNFTTGYRGHRGRPKKKYNIVLNCKSTGRAAQLVRKAISVQASRFSTKANTSQLRFKMKPSPDNKMYQASVTGQRVPSLSLPRANSVEPLSAAPDLNSSDDHVEIVPTLKGGMRRKHHRPWTLREVMKLVEGVACCGVGKWAEIKKLAFSNSVYRTSVDLKDKWRNLLRASDTHLQAIKQGEHRRKHTSAPIPGPILVRVRELAALQSQPLCVNLESGISRSGRTVHKRHFI